MQLYITGGEIDGETRMRAIGDLSAEFIGCGNSSIATILARIIRDNRESDEMRVFSYNMLPRITGKYPLAAASRLVDIDWDFVDNYL